MVGRNKHIARSKALLEVLEIKSDEVGDPGYTLYQTLSEEMRDGNLPFSLEEVEKNLAKYRAEKDQIRENQKKMLRMSILMKRYAAAETA